MSACTSYVADTRDSFPEGTAHKIGELKLDPPGNDYKDPFNYKEISGRCWHITFSPDETIFAWLANPRRVILVPWDREKNCLRTAPPSSAIKGNCDYPDSLGKPVVQQPEEILRQNPVTIECRYPVVAMSFGSGESQTNPGKVWTKAHWTRFDFSKQLILATGHMNGRIRIWNTQSGQLMLDLMDHTCAIRALSFAPDGSLRLISGALDKTLKGWDLRDDGNMFKTFYAHQESVYSCCWSPNANLMVSTGNQKTVFIWDMTTYKNVRRLHGHCQTVISSAFSPDGAVLATASWDTQVILWDPYLGHRLYSLYHLNPPPNMIYASGANNAWVRGVAYSKNGLNVVTISDDKFIRFWNLAGDVDPEGIVSEDEDALSCCFSPTGRCVAIGTVKYKVTFYASPMVVPRLTHLARMAVRKCVHTADIDGFEIPETLKSYLKYGVW